MLTAWDLFVGASRDGLVLGAMVAIVVLGYHLGCWVYDATLGRVRTRRVAAGLVTIIAIWSGITLLVTLVP